MGGDRISNWEVVSDGLPAGRDGAVTVEKPPYRIPTMAEVAAVPRNGLTVASLFAGCGGSCLGYRMAGFHVVYACEFERIPSDAYSLNFPGTALDRRDVRDVHPEDVLSASGLAPGTLDVLDGSPPCQAFSTAGKLSRGWGRGTQYENGRVQRNEDMFSEYVRILRGLRPRAFVAENVAGLARGVAKGYFLQILRDLKDSGYRVACRELDAQWLGVPQMRSRLIFVGIRDDIGLDPVFPRPLPYRYSVLDALPDIGRLVQGPQVAWSDEGRDLTGGPARTVTANEPISMLVESVSVRHDEGGAWSAGDVSDVPMPALRAGRSGTLSVGGSSGCASPGNDVAVPLVGSASRRRLTIPEVARLCAFPEDFLLVGSYAQQWKCLGNVVPPLMLRAVAEALAPVIGNPPMS